MIKKVQFFTKMVVLESRITLLISLFRFIYMTHTADKASLNTLRNNYKSITVILK
jgi:hypothetical protein